MKAKLDILLTEDTGGADRGGPGMSLELEMSGTEWATMLLQVYDWTPVEFVEWCMQHVQHNTE